MRLVRRDYLSSKNANSFDKEPNSIYLVITLSVVGAGFIRLRRETSPLQSHVANPICILKQCLKANSFTDRWSTTDSEELKDSR